MTSFEPYIIVTNTPETMQLSLSKAREGIYQVTYRAVPVIIILSAWFIMQEMDTNMPAYIQYLLIAVALAALAMLIFRSYVQEITVQASHISITQKTIRGSRYIRLAVTDIEKIAWHKHGRKVKFFLLVALSKQAKEVELLRIPKRYIQQQNLQAIAGIIHSITGLPVV